MRFDGDGVCFVPAIERSVPCFLGNHGICGKLQRIHMRPDYIHKIFDDKRLCYFLLMEALAMDAAL
jgi:hypothetical protein